MTGGGATDDMFETVLGAAVGETATTLPLLPEGNTTAAERGGAGGAATSGGGGGCWAGEVGMVEAATTAEPTNAVVRVPALLTPTAEGG